MNDICHSMLWSSVFKVIHSKDSGKYRWIFFLTWHCLYNLFISAPIAAPSAITQTCLSSAFCNRSKSFVFPCALSHSSSWSSLIEWKKSYPEFESSTIIFPVLSAKYFHQNISYTSAGILFVYSCIFPKNADHIFLLRYRADYIDFLWWSAHNNYLNSE